MNDLEFSFEQPAWMDALQKIPTEGRISALHFLTMMEQETDDAREEAFAYLETQKIALDISDLPKSAGTGQAAVRLRREAELVRAGTLRRDLEENDPLRLYLDEVETLKKPTDVDAIAARFAGGYEQALPALTNAMLPTVIDRACALTERGVLLMDLIQEGSLGLWQGILSYRGGDFRTYVQWWIDQYLAKAVVLQAQADGLGQKLKQATQDYRAADEWLLSELGRNPTLEEIAERIHLTIEQTQTVADTLEKVRLLQQAHPQPQEDENTEQDDQAVEDTAYFQMRRRVADLLDTLTAQDAQILTLRFGLEGGLPESAQSVGQKLDLTPEEVLAREEAALAKLRKEG